MHLVPAESREEKVPCRHIPFNEAGETLDSLYRHGDQHEIEDAVRVWLKVEIARLEESRKKESGQDVTHSAHVTSSPKGRPLGHEIGPKCANPACHTAFHWHEGGKFFRFRPDSGAATEAHGGSAVKHFWLCERCCHKFTLVYTEGHGVLVKPMPLEVSLSEDPKDLGEAAVTWQAPR